MGFTSRQFQVLWREHVPGLDEHHNHGRRKQFLGLCHCKLRVYFCCCFTYKTFQSNGWDGKTPEYPTPSSCCIDKTEEGNCGWTYTNPDGTINEEGCVKTVNVI